MNGREKSALVATRQAAATEASVALGSGRLPSKEPSSFASPSADALAAGAVCRRQVTCHMTSGLHDQVNMPVETSWEWLAVNIAVPLF